jgi:hypothetical protein
MSLVSIPRKVSIDPDGVPRVGAQWYFYEAGTDTAIPTYTTAALAVEHQIPVLSQSDGYFPAVFIDSEAYPTHKQVMLDADGLTIFSEDNLVTSDEALLRADLASAVAGDDGARLVGFRRDDAGAAARTVYDKLYDHISVHDFGALPSASIAVNTVAINAALDLGSDVSITRPGVYLVNDSLLLPSNTTFRIGAGVTIRASHAGGVTWGAGGTAEAGLIKVDGVENVHITGAGIVDGNKADGPTGRVWGLDINESDHVLVDGALQFNNCPGQDATGINQGDGICVRGDCTDITIGAVTCDGNVRQGISIVSVVGMKCIGTVCKNTTGSAPGAGIDIEGDAPGEISGVELIGVTLKDNYIGLQLADADHVKVIGCRIESNSWNDLYAIRTTNLQVDAATTVVAAPTVAQNGIAYFFQCEHVRMDAEIVGSYDAQEGPGIKLDDGCVDFYIGSRIRNTYSIGIQIGKSALAEDILDVVVAATLNNCCDPSVNLPAIFIDGATGSFNPKRVRILPSTTISDDRSGGNEATAGVQVSTNVSEANKSGYRIAPSYINGPTVRLINPPLWGSVTWNPASAADGVGETSADITVTGAAVGDSVEVFPPENLLGVLYAGYVSASNTVKIRIQNESGGVVDLGNSDWYVRVRKRYE